MDDNIDFKDLEDVCSLETLKMEFYFNHSFLKFFQDFLKKEKNTEYLDSKVEMFCKYNFNKITYLFKLADQSDLKVEFNIDLIGDFDDEYKKTKFPIYHKYSFDYFSSSLEFFNPQEKILVAFPRSPSNDFGEVSLSQNIESEKSVDVIFLPEGNTQDELVQKRLDIVEEVKKESKILVNFVTGKEILEILNCLGQEVGINKPDTTQFYFKKLGEGQYYLAIEIFGDRSGIQEGEYEFEFDAVYFNVKETLENEFKTIKLNINTEIFENVQNFIDEHSGVSFYLNSERSVVMEIAVGVMTVGYMMPCSVNSS